MSDSEPPGAVEVDASPPLSPQQQEALQRLPPSWEEWLGPTLIRNSTNKEGVQTHQTISTAEALENKDLVLLYFSAAWCPPCQAFGPLLKKFYHGAAEAAATAATAATAAAADADATTTTEGTTDSSSSSGAAGGGGVGDLVSTVEIIYISSDNAVAQFQEYFGTMPWLSLPMMQGMAAVKTNLAKALHVTGIPALIVLSNSTSYPLYVTDQARGQVTAAVQQDMNKTSAADSDNNGDGDNAAIQALIKEWTYAPAIPISEKKKALTQAVASGFWGIVLMMLKNPAAIIALVYAFKWLYQKFNAYFAVEDGDVPATPTTTVDAANSEL